jgi:hypothetical protein
VTPTRPNGSTTSCSKARPVADQEALALDVIIGVRVDCPNDEVVTALVLIIPEILSECDKARRELVTRTEIGVTEKASKRRQIGDREATNSVLCRSSVENRQKTSKPMGSVTPGSVWTTPAYGPHDVRHRGSAALFQALTLNCGNLRRRCQANGTSPENGEADSSNAPPRDGAARSSVDPVVMEGGEGVASSGRHGRSTRRPGGIPHDLQAL